ncbi:unnamed protein product (macronuclear) [Paramecium tetraurelia]|uniref:Ubiquitin-like protease family profile domain-containing protein n=1 Tax=Paramecium tetraurelia TaxID=5888 RepID=A0BRM5_PARTE|nr:uncharacterized protein GSPATT00031423001 [Paramecium tetraurelia]CAK61192.1 unnamed protein product [Paramecium tetraurelia]|eukprot:XP_001428590.1 hypothetical protein (macronuclear) [Paramecium tetraurelia strain d4-2]
MQQLMLQKQKQEEFNNKFFGRAKKGMLKRFFFYDRTLNYVETPIFTEFSGRKQIVPMRNTQCLKPTCIYDLQELYERYEKQNYSSYANFMCHTCRKMIDLQGFYMDEDMRKINEVIWNTYNKFSIQCSKAAIFKDGSWEAVLPEYLKRMYRKNVEDYDAKQNDDDLIDQPDEILKFELPLLHEFDVQEYAELLEQEDEGDERHHDSDILLRRYNLQVKWGEFTQFKNQVAVSINVMGIFMRYLHDYLEDRKNTFKMQAKLKLGVLCIKVVNYDRFSKRAEFFFLSDNLEGPKANYTEYEQVIMAIYYDERWIALICDIEARRLKMIDFLEETIARTTLDEVYELGQYLISQIFQPYKFAKNPSRELLIGQIQEDMRNEIPRKIQLYCDCGHHIAQYFYYYILEEIELMKIQQKWPQDVGLKQKIHNVKYKLGEQDYFTAKICWVLLKMAQNTGFKILVYDMKPKEKIEKDTLDDFVIEQARLKAEKLWEDNKQQKQTTFQVVHGFNQVEEVVISKSNDKQNDQKQNKQKSRVEKYWGVESGIQFNNQRNLQPNNAQQQQKDNSLLSNLSFQFGNQDKPIVRHQSQLKDDSKSIYDVLGEMNGNNNNNNNQKKEVQNQKKEKPFLVMPKAQLQQYLSDYKQQIITEYKQQALLKGYKQQMIGEFNVSGKKKQAEYDSKQLTESQYHRLLLNLDKSLNQSEQRELKQLQSELGLNEQDLANLDAYQYDQILDMMNQ